MIKLKQLIQLLVNQTDDYVTSEDKLQKKDIVETKKCKNCLRRVESENYKCPYCRCKDFHYD